MQQEETKKLRRIKQISVKNLFGIFNHTIPLNMDERITIIHGPNGFGKTMMLKLLYALFSMDNRLLRTIPFDEFRVDFDNATSFWMNKPSHKLEESEMPSDQAISFHITGKKPFLDYSKSLFGAKNYTGTETDLEQKLSFIEQADSVNQLLMFSPDTLAELNNQLSARRKREAAKLPEWLIEMRNSVSLRFIETQRLLSHTLLFRRRIQDSEKLSEYAIKADSKNLVELIKKKLAESASLSQSLDRSFPARLISPTNQQLQVEEEELRDKLIKLEKKRERLMATGLLDPETGPTFPVNAHDEQEINPNTKAVLAVYVEDTEQKLGIFDELAQKIGLLTTIINSRFLYKTLTIDKEQGLIFTSKNGTILPLETLSSGEQHELVLFYELLFRTNPGSLILIDEPELSLHVVWQRQFLKDIQQVAHLTNIDIVLATHSPDIIDDRRDLVVELEAPKNGRV